MFFDNYLNFSVLNPRSFVAREHKKSIVISHIGIFFGQAMYFLKINIQI